MNSKKARGPQTASPTPSPERLGRGCKRRMRSRGWPCPSGAGAPALGRALAGGLRASARVVRRSMECLSPDLAVSPIRPSSAACFALLRPRRDGVRRGFQAPVVGGSPGSGNALLAGMRPPGWGRRSSYGNGFGNFSRYITEPRDLPSESSRPTPDIRLSALIRAIVSPWKGVSEPPSSATVKYRKFSSIPLPCPKEQGDAGGRRRAIAGLHGAVVHGMRGDPLRTWRTAGRRSCLVKSRIR